CAAPALKGTDAGEALKREPLGDLRVNCSKGSVRSRRGDQLEAETFGVVEAEPVVLALRLEARPCQPVGPEVERLLRADAKADAVDHPRARAPARQARILEEGEVGARAAVLVGVEEVVDAGV